MLYILKIQEDIRHEIVFKDGRKETFGGVVSFNVTEEQITKEECHASDLAQTPSEGKLFEVNPLEIDRSKFEKPMSNRKQEWTRQIIQEAFAEVDKHPEKYASAFYTLMPEKKWNGLKTVAELNAYANDLDGQMADWVEQALEWAQRLFNGESWETICNNADTAYWYRVILWKNGCYRLVGGSRNYNVLNPASDVFDYDYGSFNCIYDTVPLVVLKKK